MPWVPSASARLIGTYDSGTRVEILGTENGWTEVIIRGVSGYVKSDYVSTTYSGSGAVLIEGNSGNTLVIVPDGPAISSGVTVTPTPAGTNFLGILPD